LNPRHLFSQPLCWFMNCWISDRGYWIKVYSDIRYNVGLRSLQSDIGSSDIKLSPISLITDIGVSAHLCWVVKCCRYDKNVWGSNPAMGDITLHTECVN
jgi:hypothetical protein